MSSFCCVILKWPHYQCFSRCILLFCQVILITSSLRRESRPDPLPCFRLCHPDWIRAVSFCCEWAVWKACNPVPNAPLRAAGICEWGCFCFFFLFFFYLCLFLLSFGAIMPGQISGDYFSFWCPCVCVCACVYVWFWDLFTRSLNKDMSSLWGQEAHNLNH